MSYYHDTQQKTRQATCILIEGAKDGLYSWETIARACLNYMSEDDVADMASSEGLIEDDDDEDTTIEGEEN